MLSVRLFIVVAGVLLMSDANQPEATTHQSRLNQNPRSKPFLVDASNENEKAISLLTVFLIPEDDMLEGINKALITVQRELNKLLEGTVENRAGHLLAALDYEFFAYFLPRQCTFDNKCNEVSGHVQRATGKMIAAMLQELSDDSKKDEIKKLINGNITENGDIEKGASVQQTKKVAQEVRYCLYGAC